MSEYMDKLLDEASAETSAWLDSLPPALRATAPSGLLWFTLVFPRRNNPITEADRLLAALLEGEHVRRCAPL